MTTSSYDERTGRNIGIFTVEQQQRIRNLTVAIAGTGGAGGALAVALARLGVGSFRLADPEVFEPSNINRQFGAYVDTVGQRKTDVVAEEVRRINPDATIRIENDGITGENVERFVAGSDCVVDEVDFFTLDAQLMLHETARAHGLPVFQGLIAGSVASFMWMSPDGESFRDVFGVSEQEDAPSMQTVLDIMLPVMPVEAARMPALLDAVVAGEPVAIPSWAHASFATCLFLLEDIVRVMVLGDPAIGPGPDMYCVDLHSRRFIFRRAGQLTHG